MKRERLTNCIYCGFGGVIFLRQDEYGIEYYMCRRKQCSESILRDRDGEFGPRGFLSKENLKHKAVIEKMMNEFMYVRYYSDRLQRFVYKITGGRINLRVKPYRHCVRCSSDFTDRSDRSWFCSIPCALTSGGMMQERARKQVNEWFAQ